MLRLLLIWIGKSLALLMRLRGGGSALPGYVVERLSPKFIHTLRPHFEQIVLVTGTNGKTTTTKMLQKILCCKYDQVIHNQAGSNMSRGVISAVLDAMDWRGNLQAEVGLFEIDEGFAVLLAEALQPDVFTILNLHRDQLDRYGELERVVTMLHQAAELATQTIINYDEPRLKELSNTLEQVSGVAAARKVRARVPHDDALYLDTPDEGEEYREAKVFVEQVTSKRSRQQLKLKIDGQMQEATLRIPGVFNAYNAAMAVATGLALGVSAEDATRALARVRPAFGRTEEIELGDKTLQLLLVKNPSGFNQVVASFLQDSDIPVLIAINDNYADGRDVSWLWDVTIEQWQPEPSQTVITSGTRGYDMALRLQYAEIESSCELEITRAIDQLLEAIPEGGRGYIIPTYTAMLEVRKVLSRHTELGEWE